MIYEIDPELGTISYGRDAVGNVVSKKVGSSGTTSFVLDNLYRVDYITYPTNGSQPAFTVDYDYYKNGLLKQAVRSNVTWDYTYDLNNSPELERATIGGVQYGITYGHDTRDSLSSVTYPSGLVVSYQPNAFGQATRVTSGLGTHIGSVTYFPNGQIDTLTYANGYTSDYGQNNRLLPTTLKTTATRNGAAVNLIDVEYGYDAAANVQNIFDYRDASKQRSMSYDGVNRLRTATGPYGSGGAQATGAFTYDARHNLLTKSFPSQAFTYDSGSNLVTVGSPARIQYTYDGNGRMAIDSRVDGTSTRYSLHTRAERRLYDIDIVNKEATDYIYLGNLLIASRSRCIDSSDADGDTLTNFQEFQLHTRPDRVDTDGDGIPDNLDSKPNFNPAILMPILQLILE